MIPPFHSSPYNPRLMTTLALDGGTPALNFNPKPWNTIGAEEIAATTEVLQSGILSGFVGVWGDAFHGGPQVQALESEWSHFFKIKHSISMNSATSGLYAAMGACGILPGDEVIVPPLSMSATATAPLVYGGIPVFADVDSETFTLNPDSVAKCITKKTKAIIVVNLFGHPGDLDPILKLAQAHNLTVIEDNAQGPGAKYHGKFAGCVAHMGIFSLNRHKHIQCGEGGIVVTNDDTLAMRLKLIRNHAEAVVEGKGETNLTNMVGWNYRMTELEAAVARCQLKKLPRILNNKIAQAEQLTKHLKKIEFLSVPVIKNDCTHVYYTYPILYKSPRPTRDLFVKALAAEGVPIVARYNKPLYLAPLFQNRTAFGVYPFSLSSEDYSKGICPVAERLHESDLFYIPWCSYDFTDEQIDGIGMAFEKVASHLTLLQSRAA